MNKRELEKCIIKTKKTIETTEKRIRRNQEFIRKGNLVHEREGSVSRDRELLTFMKLKLKGLIAERVEYAKA